MINILVTLNANYIPPLKVMLSSLFFNNPEEKFSVYMMYSDISEERLQELHMFFEKNGQCLFPIFVEPMLFADAPIFRHYTSEMYYRLAAHQFLPNDLDRVLYLDPDIVVINTVKSFYESDFENCLFIAAEHKHSTKVASLFNKLRLKTPNAKGYFNTGVLLMNLEGMRKAVNVKDIYQFIEENRLKLVLPDQDVLNALYWDKIKPADCYRYNFDARYYEITKRLPNPKYSLEWIKQNTVFIHYCGKDKPWMKNYKGELGAFYKQYEKMAANS